MIVWVALGGALGSVLRFVLAGLVAERFGEAFPWGTLLVNVSGCFAIGIFAAFSEPGQSGGSEGWLARPEVRQFFMTGICGGYTTFSAFSLQTLNLAKNGEWFAAGFNSVASLVLCLLAVWLGHFVALSLATLSLNSMKG